jgi:hypothetical protein
MGGRSLSIALDSFAFRVSGFLFLVSCFFLAGVVHCPYSCTCMYVMQLLESIVSGSAVCRLLVRQLRWHSAHDAHDTHQNTRTPEHQNQEKLRCSLDGCLVRRVIMVHAYIQAPRASVGIIYEPPSGVPPVPPPEFRAGATSP